jgi:hypothetical protein
MQMLRHVTCEGAHAVGNRSRSSHRNRNTRLPLKLPSFLSESGMRTGCVEFFLASPVAEPLGSLGI